MITLHEELACYRSDYGWAVISLLRRGYELFHKAPAVQHLEEIQILLSKSSPTAAEHAQDIHAAFKLTDPTLDIFCIVTAFDCIAKGFLVKERIAIHQIDEQPDKSLSDLRKKQKKKPISISEVLEHEARLLSQSSVDQGVEQLKVLKDETLAFSVSLQKSYWSRIGFDEDLVKLLATLARRRNTELHYFMLWFSQGGQSFDEAIRGYAWLKGYIETHVLELHNRLAQEFGYVDWQLSKS